MIYGIFGHHTGGTSAVAGVVRIHGVQMYGMPKTLDDYEFKAALEKGREKDLIAARGQNWAFKHPLILKHAHHLIDKFNIKPIYVYRDPAAIWMNSGKTPTREKILKSCDFYQELAELPEGLYVSFEKLQTEKERVCRQIADYINEPFNPTALNWVDNKRSYTDIEAFLN